MLVIKINKYHEEITNSRFRDIRAAFTRILTAYENHKYERLVMRYYQYIDGLRREVTPHLTNNELGILFNDIQCVRSYPEYAFIKTSILVIDDYIELLKSI